MIDYTGIAERIIEVLQADPEFAKVSFRFGELPKRDNVERFPTIYVTTDQNPFKTNEGTGSLVPSDSQTLTQFQIGVVVDGSRPERTKPKLLKLTEHVIRVLRANRTLTVGADAKFIRSFVSAIPENPENRGKKIQDMLVTLQGQVGSRYYFEMPGLTIDLLSKPLESPRVNLDKDLQDDRVQMYTEIDREGQLHVEYENTESRRAHIQGIVDATDEIPVKIIDEGVERPYTVVMQNPQSTAQFDQIERVVLSMFIVR